MGEVERGSQAIDQSRHAATLSVANEVRRIAIHRVERQALDAVAEDEPDDDEPDDDELDEELDDEPEFSDFPDVPDFSDFPDAPDSLVDFFSLLPESLEPPDARESVR